MRDQVILQDASHRRWLRFQNPVQTIATTRLEEVRLKLEQVESAVNRWGFHAAGFLSYEAAPAFDAALRVREAGSAPLLWFGLYEQPEVIAPPFSDSFSADKSYRLGAWRPSVEKEAYDEAIAQIKMYIEAAYTYQVNYTFRLKADFHGQAWPFFVDLAQAQQAEYVAFLDIGTHTICSASPELFFKLDGSKLCSKPMKGTIARGRTLAEDHELADWLYQSEKNRAENVMIVDMIRNDMGRVGIIGSVEVPHLFEVEKYPTLWQMTSTVTSSTNASLSEIMAALFPCASITGAPKVSTMKIIAALESSPRGLYTGCIGYLSPGRQAQFNVAIRTVVVDKAEGTAEYGVGGGIVWDSRTEEEFHECQTKARILTHRRPEFHLLETLRWTPVEGYFLLDEHLRRLEASAVYFGYEFDEGQLRRKLAQLSLELPNSPHKVRLLAGRDGQVKLESDQIVQQKLGRVGLAVHPIDSSDIFLYHKTTRRDVYEEARASRPDCQEVLLWNERGQITEASSSNVVVKLGSRLLTPPVDCGLLGGTFRDHLLREGVIIERIITVEDLKHCQALYLINSVRKWREADLGQEWPDRPPILEEV